MQRRQGPHLAPAIFSAVIVLAVGALAWGATHGKSQGHGVGSAKDQAAARTTLTALQLPAGFARDPSFTACGNVTDACLTSKANTAETLTELRTIMHSAGGSLPRVCDTTFSPPTGAAGPGYTCAVQGELKGAQVVFLLGDGWVLPGNLPQRTAVVATIETGPTPPAAAPLDPKPGSAADAASLLPATWASAPKPCAGGSTPPGSAPASSAATPSATTPSLITTPPLPACAVTAITDNVSVHVALADAAAQLSKLALGKGFRLDGHPCIADSTPTNCTVRGERISSGVQQLFVAALIDDGRGDTIGTLAVTRQTRQK